ncbi:hypothetical protein O3P69_011402 [Scylla paramamosain]|uniref:THAP-type domain-containing protein n=1 Tax=Scylla paramamosain TaxID=85552 RepID=A0AAW0T608_SCYPA
MTYLACPVKLDPFPDMTHLANPIKVDSIDVMVEIKEEQEELDYDEHDEGQDAKRRQQWVQTLNIAYVKHTQVVCEDHFVPHHIGSKGHLLSTAVPIPTNGSEGQTSSSVVHTTEQQASSGVTASAEAQNVAETDHDASTLYELPSYDLYASGFGRLEEPCDVLLPALPLSEVYTSLAQEPSQSSTGYLHDEQDCFGTEFSVLPNAHQLLLHPQPQEELLPLQPCEEDDDNNLDHQERHITMSSASTFSFKENSLPHDDLGGDNLGNDPEDTEYSSDDDFAFWQKMKRHAKRREIDENAKGVVQAVGNEETYLQKLDKPTNGDFSTHFGSSSGRSALLVPASAMPPNSTPASGVRTPKRSGFSARRSSSRADGPMTGLTPLNRSFAVLALPFVVQSFKRCPRLHPPRKYPAASRGMFSVRRARTTWCTAGATGLTSPHLWSALPIDCLQVRSMGQGLRQAGRALLFHMQLKLRVPQCINNQVPQKDAKQLTHCAQIRFVSQRLQILDQQLQRLAPL